MNDDNGFEFFNGDLQQQYFNYYLFSTVMQNEQPPQQMNIPMCCQQLPDLRSPQPFTKKYEDYLNSRKPQSSFDPSRLICCLSIIAYIALVIATLIYI